MSPSSFEKLANSAVSTDMEKYVIDNNTDPDVDPVPNTVVDAGADTCDDIVAGCDIAEDAVGDSDDSDDVDKDC